MFKRRTESFSFNSWTSLILNVWNLCIFCLVTWRIMKWMDWWMRSTFRLLLLLSLLWKPMLQNAKVFTKILTNILEQNIMTHLEVIGTWTKESLFFIKIIQLDVTTLINNLNPLCCGAVRGKMGFRKDRSLNDHNPRNNRKQTDQNRKCAEINTIDR